MVVPVAAATGRCWPRKTWRFFPGTVDISIGPALKPQEGEDAIAFMKRVETWIEAEMRVIDSAAYID